MVRPYQMIAQDSLSWPPQNPLSYFPFPSSGNSQQVNLFWTLLLWRIARTIRVCKKWCKCWLAKNKFKELISRHRFVFFFCCSFSFFKPYTCNFNFFGNNTGFFEGHGKLGKWWNVSLISRLIQNANFLRKSFAASHCSDFVRQRVPYFCCVVVHSNRKFIHKKCTVVYNYYTVPLRNTRTL